MEYTLHGLPVRIPTKHMQQHADVFQHLQRALDFLQQYCVYPSHNIVAYEAVLDRVVGTCACVETTAEDDVVYAVRSQRQGRAMRFVRNRNPEMTNRITVVLKSVSGGYQLLTAYYGSPAPREPNDPSLSRSEREEAIQFWNTHALTWGSQQIIKSTVTMTKPW